MGVFVLGFVLLWLSRESPGKGEIWNGAEENPRSRSGETSVLPGRGRVAVFGKEAGRR
jgi:hypothetical protein